MISIPIGVERAMPDVNLMVLIAVPEKGVPE
jgi:hypothetical protein